MGWAASSLFSRLTLGPGGSLWGCVVRLFRFCRFRPNIVIGGQSAPWLEDTWAEIAVEPSVSLISDGSNTNDVLEPERRIERISLVSKGTRCLLPNVNPDDGIRDDAVPYKVCLPITACLSFTRFILFYFISPDVYSPSPKASFLSLANDSYLY